MELTLDARDGVPIVIGATGMDAIVQNLRMILLTLCWSVPLDRAFAHYGRMIDAPAPQDAWRKSAELIDAIEKYEPRVKVHKLEFVYDDQQGQLQEGRLTPRLSFSIKREVEL